MAPATSTPVAPAPTMTKFSAPSATSSGLCATSLEELKDARPDVGAHRPASIGWERELGRAGVRRSSVRARREHRTSPGAVVPKKGTPSARR